MEEISRREDGDAGGGQGGRPPDNPGDNPLQTGEQAADPNLVFSGRFCGGLFSDVKRKVPFLPRDFIDALHVQTISTIFFMYFSTVTLFVLYGGLLGQATGFNIAVTECLLGGAICGVVYQLYSGQPLAIIGPTGPILVFETILYNFCQNYGWSYLEFRAWIGLWTCVWLLVIVVTDLSFLVRYITRFTWEVFLIITGSVFIYEAFYKLYLGLERYNRVEALENCIPNCIPPNFDHLTLERRERISNSTILWGNLTRDECIMNYGHADESGCERPSKINSTFLFTCLLFAGTFILTLVFKYSKNIRCVPNRIRIVFTVISDFAVFLAIFVMVLVDYLAGLHTHKLMLPQRFALTMPDRTWSVNPFLFLNPWWSIPAGIPPSLLSTIFIIMDQQITAVIINRKEHKLKKGAGYHLDVLILTLQIFISSVIGAPWFVASTILSLNHVHSLAIESKATAPGERPKFIGTREQRVTGLVVFILIGVSVFMSNFLKVIPLAVLYGVFFYMGVMSLKGIQLMQRFMIMFMPSKYQPDYLFLRNVKTRRVHLFTVIQLLCLWGLYVIKGMHFTSIAYPFMVLVMCLIRKALGCVFTQDELKWLDGTTPDPCKRRKNKTPSNRPTNAAAGEGENIINLTDTNRA